MTLRFLVVAALAAGLCACGSDPSRPPPSNPFKPEQAAAREQRLQAGELYRLARESLDANDFQGASQRYGVIILRYPFTDYAVQSQLEKVYAMYRSFQFEEALIDADRFMRDYPRHAHIDYLQYLKGLINAERDQSFTASLGFDTSARDVGNLRKAFDDFALLVQKYPKSRYAGDGRQRMIHLRNRIAEHELTVVEYYVRRGALVAATKRAEQIISQYPGAPAAVRALELMAEAYTDLGLKDQAEDARKLLQAQRATAPAAPVSKEEKGFFSRLFTPGSEGAAGYEIVIPQQQTEVATAADAGSLMQPPPMTSTAAPDTGNAGEHKLGTLRVYMEPYDDAPTTQAAPVTP